MKIDASKVKPKRSRSAKNDSYDEEEIYDDYARKRGSSLIATAYTSNLSDSSSQKRMKIDASKVKPKRSRSAKNDSYDEEETYDENGLAFGLHIEDIDEPTQPPHSKYSGLRSQRSSRSRSSANSSVDIFDNRRYDDGNTNLDDLDALPSTRNRNR